MTSNILHKEIDKSVYHGNTKTAKIKSKFLGVVAGNLEVCANSELDFYGIVTGDLVVQKGGTIYLHGLVCSNLILKGGKTYLDGVIIKKIIHSEGELIKVTPAVVKKIVCV